MCKFLFQREVPSQMSDDYVTTVSERYIELYENITGEVFVKADVTDIQSRIETNVLNYLKTL